ncbi:2 -5 -phosphodiesterase, partial [Brachionus plicatilis]
NLLQKFRDSTPKILFAADLNAFPFSSPFDYITNRVLNFPLLNENQQNCLKMCSRQINHSLELRVFTNYEFSYINGVVDYVFYDSNYLELTKFVPLPKREKLKELISIPNRFKFLSQPLDNAIKSPKTTSKFVFMEKTYNDSLKNSQLFNKCLDLKIDDILIRFCKSEICEISVL